MNSGDFKMTVELLESGQSDNYQPTAHEYRVYFHWIPFNAKLTKVWEPWPAADRRELVLPYLRAVHGWVEEGDGDWASERLKKLQKVGPGTWQFRVEQPYTG
jgi:hypothetical protein